MFGRQTKTKLNTVQEPLKPLCTEQVSQNLLKARLNQKTYGDRQTSTRKDVKIDDRVALQTGHRQWVTGNIVDVDVAPRSVLVRTDEGRVYRRNTIHLKETKAKVPTPTRLSTSLSQGEEVNSPTEPTETTKLTENRAVTTRSGRLIKPPVRLNL